MGPIIADSENYNFYEQDLIFIDFGLVFILFLATRENYMTLKSSKSTQAKLPVFRHFILVNKVNNNSRLYIFIFILYLFIPS